MKRDPIDHTEEALERIEKAEADKVRDQSEKEEK